jgi:hypothetical protein
LAGIGISASKADLVHWRYEKAKGWCLSHCIWHLEGCKTQPASYVIAAADYCAENEQHTEQMLPVQATLFLHNFWQLFSTFNLVCRFGDSFHGFLPFANLSHCAICNALISIFVPKRKPLTLPNSHNECGHWVVELVIRLLAELLFGRRGDFLPGHSGRGCGAEYPFDPSLLSACY